MRPVWTVTNLNSEPWVRALKGTTRMSKVIVVTSGKGGVGKTTSTASLGVALAQGGKRVCVVDFDVGLRNLDLVMGAERRVVFDFINVAQGDAKLSQALIRDKRIDTLHLLAASQTRDKDALTTDGVEKKNSLTWGNAFCAHAISSTT